MDVKLEQGCPEQYAVIETEDRKKTRICVRLYECDVRAKLRAMECVARSNMYAGRRNRSTNTTICKDESISHPGLSNLSNRINYPHSNTTPPR